MSVENQNIIYGSVLAPCDKDNLYMVVNQEALFAAMEDLKLVGLRMWLYFSKNQANHKFDLSLEACKKLGINKNTYYAGIKELEEKGYLVAASGNGFFFYQIPKFRKPSEIQNGMITNIGTKFSEIQNPNSEIQNEPSEFQNKSSEFQERNITNNTDNTINNTFLSGYAAENNDRENKGNSDYPTLPIVILNNLKYGVDYSMSDGLIVLSDGSKYRIPRAE